MVWLHTRLQQTLSQQQQQHCNMMLLWFLTLLGVTGV
jgi:hypothetical protein